jgi:CheY-like chemotaxis protein
MNNTNILSRNENRILIPTQDNLGKINTNLKNVNNVRPNNLVKRNNLLVLLVEDDRLARIVEEYLLQQANCDVQIVSDVASAKKILEALKFVLVISDLGLPDGSGIDIIRHVKSNEHALNYSTPFFALTAHSDNDPDILRETAKAGFQGTIFKPLTEEKICSLLN